MHLYQKVKYVYFKTSEGSLLWSLLLISPLVVYAAWGWGPTM